jgi:hypothetical protein
VIISLPIAACSLGVGTTGGGTQVSSVSSSETAAVPTPNVHYSGALDRLELSSFMQGTHKLTLDDGQMILLESSDANLDLDAYIGKSVEAHGSVQPTVEAGGTLMRVTEISILTTGIPEDTSSSSAGNTMCGGIAGIPCEEGMTCIDDASDSCDPKSGGADCSGICVSPIVVSSTSSVSLSSTSSSAVASSKPMSSLASSLPASSPSSSVSSASSSSSFSSLSSAPNSIMEQQIKTMASQVYDDASLWTQKYCTSHVGFCIPVHKNWYFKSFGATTTNLWHVEFGMTTIDALGDGAMILNLVSGTSSSMLAADGQIKTQGSDVIGFKDWADGKHFEIIADQRLRKAVEYMISQITSYELAQ